MTYYHIDEQTARRSHDMMSYSDYREGSKTAEYRALVDAAAELAERQKAKKPEYAETIDHLLDRYANKLAVWMNTESRIGAMCPSVLIAGGDGLPARRKQKQIERMDAHMRKRAVVDELLHRMKTIGTGGIKASDENVLIKLTDKLEDLKDSQETMKAVNAYYRKHHTLDGCDLLPFQQIEQLKASMARSYRAHPVPFESYHLSNNNAEIHRIECRIREIGDIKAAGDTELDTEIDGLRVIENTSIMRIQFFFDEKPDAEVRAILKSNGFHFAKSQNNAWQRQLNIRGRSAAARAVEQIAALHAGKREGGVKDGQA